MEAGKLIELADPKLEDEFDMDELHKMVLTASYCVRQSSIWRPSMTEVIYYSSIHNIQLRQKILIKNYSQLNVFLEGEP